MANSTAAFSIALSYAAPGGNTRSEPAAAVTVPYQAQASGTIDIPVGATAGSTQTIPFGSIAEATLVELHNNTSATLDVRFNGATVTSFAMPAGAKMAFASPTAAGATNKLASMVVMPTATQAAVETVAYWIFGDPT